MINLFFIIHDHSGARTYANELLGYLVSCRDIKVHKVYLNSEHYKEFSIVEENSLTSIHIPKVKRKNNALDKYSKRCIDLISPLVEGKENPIFHLNHSTQVRLGAGARENFGAKLIYTLHFLPNYFSYLEVSPEIKKGLVTTGDVLDKEILEQTDEVICISKFAREVVCSHYEIPASKICIIYNGCGNIDVGRTNKRKQWTKERFGFGKNERIILYAGRLSEDKGVHTLIKAFRRIVAIFPDARLVFAGGGEFKEFFPMCNEVTGKVTFTGNLELSELQTLYNLAEIGVCPSYFELLGYAPIEMMAQQLPVIISDVPGMKELIEDGTTGLVCGVTKRKDGLLSLETDEESLYEKIKLLLENKALAQKLARNAHTNWQNHYTSTHMGQATMKVYEQLQTDTIDQSNQFKFSNNFKYLNLQTENK